MKCRETEYGKIFLRSLDQQEDELVLYLKGSAPYEVMKRHSNTNMLPRLLFATARQIICQTKKKTRDH